MNVILTGATGFVGSYVLAELLKINAKVAVILRPQSDLWRIKSLLPQCTLIEQNLESIDLAQNAINEFCPDALIHLAWEGVTNDKRNDATQITKNITVAHNLFTVMQKAGIKTLIGFGSQAEYGPANQVVDELTPTEPTTLYGVAKLAAHHLLKVLCAQNDIRFVWHRLFSSYGPKDHQSWFIPFLINELMNGRQPDMTAGTQLWDYIYVEDAARAVVATLVNLKSEGAFNLGSGESITIRSIAEMIRDQINPELTLGFGKVPFRPDQVMHLQADITRLNELALWQPQVPFLEGCTRTIEWYRTNGYSKN
ncbi:dTDP-glucose 4,6-dehydratase 2 [Legionella massiliensis]|uniref:dTDP-glucose 4,6-dehydratase 2 n=1 Tax=Legionella massiliensis TaxID=1034943 RepID=A0A078KWV7_9GAMM|nr:NAD(P)-dependent oxidoreductase [Legionella massiliensis]CDZ76223.1 dTDP-glucose 4,6-dehydratase 2 [Legionella massiliensis]CEE11961.1 dTDP-6-deoxy-L-talose 4-dehydrogenase (NAD(+)) [Legionella massiliensis]